MIRLFSLLPLLFSFGVLGAAPRETPNFVLIFIDDMGYGDIGPYGSEKNRTPNLDRMAAEGMKLTSFYAAPVCSASRAQLMTGCYAPRVSVPGVFFPAGPQGLHPGEHTIADYLKKLGYATACIGKWHLGDQREFLPTRQGFDHYFGIPYSNDMGRKTLQDGRSVHPLMRDETVAELLEDEDQRRITRAYTEEAIQFIEEQAGEKRPFFLYFPHTAMHVPLFPHEDFTGRSANGTYGDWVEEVDWSVGQVLRTLQELQLEKNTLVLFTSDNGPWASKGAGGGEAGPLRGSKGCTLEGGVREPTIAWWPGRITAGSSSDAIAGTPDVLPTFVGLAGGTLKPDRKIDGVDIAPMILGETKESPRKIWHYYQGTRLKAVRSGPWKLALGPQGIGMGFKEKPADLQKREPRLYNLEREIGEVTDLAAGHPEIVAKLQAVAEEMIADIGSGKPGPGVRPAGKVENPVTLFPTQPRPAKKSSKTIATGSTKPINWDKIKKGDAFAPNAAPPVSGRPFSITCTIEGASPEGVIVAHGGSAIGYALYASEGKAVFAIRNGSDELRRITHPLSEKGESHIVAKLAKEGKLTLSVNGSDPVEANSKSLLPRNPQENFCLGHDDRNPLDPKAPKSGFNGTIRSIEVRTGK